MRIMMTDVDVDQVKALDESDIIYKHEIYNKIFKRFRGYIEHEASLRASSLPTAHVDVDDLVEVGDIQLWIAVLRWDGVTPIDNFAKRLIWTDMDRLLKYLYRQKRTPWIEDSFGRVTASRVQSLHKIDVIDKGDSPVDSLIADELYERIMNFLRKLGDRVAVSVLRLLVFPDAELLALCEKHALVSGRETIVVQNTSLAARLGVKVFRVRRARATIKSAYRGLDSK